MPSRLVALLLALTLATGALAAEGKADRPVRIGDSFAYTSDASDGQKYRIGWQKAVEEINAQGGLLGHPVEVVSRDLGGTAEEAVRVTEDLVKREKVDVLAGTIYGFMTNAIANYAAHEKIPLVTIWSTVEASLGPQNATTFSVNTAEGHALAAADLAATLKVKRWATLAPNYSWGRLAVKLFRERLTQLRPDVEFVEERWPTVDKINAAAEILALDRKAPEAVFSTLFTSDLFAFAREGTRRHFFDNKIVVAAEAGARNYRKTLGKELTGTWYGTGDPSGTNPGETEKAFIALSREKFGADPEYYTWSAYLVYRFLFAAIEKAGSTEPDAVVKALKEVSIPSPMGTLRMNPDNHRSNHGVWIGRLVPGKEGASMVDAVYKDAGPYLRMPSR